MNIPLVSIIIPTYNAALLLEETVSSALQQTYKNIEIIIVDDGSTDTTIQLFKEFQEQGVACYSIKNGGASNARNIGLKKSKGEYIQFLDADDILHKNKIEFQLKKMLQDKADVSFTTWASFLKDVTKHSEFKFKNIDYSKTRTGKEVMVSFGMDNWYMPPVAWLTHKSLIAKAGDWDIEITNNDDGEYFSRILYNTKKVVCVEQILCFYRVTPKISLSSLNSIDKFQSAMLSYDLITQLLKKDIDTELLSYSKRMYYNMYIWAQKDYPILSRRSAKEFDKLKADCFLTRKKKYWVFIKYFGLYRGTLIYSHLVSILVKKRID